MRDRARMRIYDLIVPITVAARHPHVASVKPRDRGYGRSRGRRGVAT